MIESTAKNRTSLRRPSAKVAPLLHEVLQPEFVFAPDLKVPMGHRYSRDDGQASGETPMHRF
jgi:hypothetical protein